jgi:hypothetical protein
MHLVHFVRGSRRGFAREPRIRMPRTRKSNVLIGGGALDDFPD